MTIKRNSRRIEVVVGQLERVVVAELAQDGPRGLVTSSLDEQCVQEKETCEQRVRARTVFQERFEGVSDTRHAVATRYESGL